MLDAATRREQIEDAARDCASDIVANLHRQHIPTSTAIVIAGCVVSQLIHQLPPTERREWAATFCAALMDRLDA